MHAVASKRPPQTAHKPLMTATSQCAPALPLLQAGERVYVRCIHTDVRQGMYRLEVVPPGQVDPATVLNDSSRYASLYSNRDLPDVANTY